MEGAIKTVVTVFLKSSKGKENLGGKDFQNLVKNQLKNILTVRNWTDHSVLSVTILSLDYDSTGV